MPKAATLTAVSPCSSPHVGGRRAKAAMEFTVEGGEITETRPVGDHADGGAFMPKISQHAVNAGEAVT
jgi:hypothetical protein